MKKTSQIITYLFFPGNMALAGYLILWLYFPLHEAWHFWPVLISGYVLLPLAGLLLLIQTGFLKDLHVYDRTKRDLTYLLALASTILGWFYIHKCRATSEISWVWHVPVMWAYTMNFAMLGAFILNKVWLKISAHMTGAGAFLALCWSLYITHLLPVWVPVIAVALSLLIYAARLLLKAHTHAELIAGFALGSLLTFAILFK